MADSTSLPVAEGGRPRSGGVPMPLLIVGGVGLLVVIIFMNKQTKSAPATTAAGASINAALGSIQEQNMNIMGQVGASEAKLSTELGNVNNNVMTHAADSSAAVSNVGAAVATLDTTVKEGNAKVVDSIKQSEAVVTGQTVTSENVVTKAITAAVDTVLGVIPPMTQSWAGMEGMFFRGNAGADPHSLTYTVKGGKLYGIGTYDSFLRLIGTPGNPTGWQNLGKYTTVSASDTELQSQLSGML